MKNPRQILFERHRAATARLDRVREGALAGLAEASRPRPAVPPARITLRDLLLSLRWHLAGMSALWLLATLLNASGPSAPDTAVARNTAPSPRQLLTALRENRLQLLELTEPPAAEPATDAAPPRRSGLPIFNALA
jgi:hypothetical protein